MAQKKQRRRRRRERLVLKLIILVFAVVFLSEGKLIFILITQSGSTATVQSSPEDTGSADQADGQQETETVSDSRYFEDSRTLAGLSNADTADTASVTFSAPEETETETEARHETTSNPDSASIVREQAEPVDEAWFSDAVFIGDSRMEGFRNASGITKGTFFTAVGMSLSSMTSDAIISTSEGNITVAAALSGGSYKKIYLMLGANDLGTYDWDAFEEDFISVTDRFCELEPDAQLYICSCIYVEESKVSDSYINNENADRLNAVLLSVCEQKGYYYLDLNEFLSDGKGSLLNGASSDGVHLYEKYCKEILTYLKSHYVPLEQETESASL